MPLTWSLNLLLQTQGVLQGWSKFWEWQGLCINLPTGPRNIGGQLLYKKKLLKNRVKVIIENMKKRGVNESGYLPARAIFIKVQAEDSHWLALVFSSLANLNK